ncbi:hypothetical protein VC83_07621 [Pseudogymnoascus destructans]|uniref:Uncharacterized protein n=1 Tax=Pseudogymnoascus destructans TaxID=655981 RepID=A0A177A3V1_9PEZI|nr:uncharacterized protein VC83_07621 [Pseudogymnoascus destructans]OAF55614.1 hypothetical protein VC83_07621 [Pseudogymnoascus destructans]
MRRFSQFTAHLGIVKSKMNAKISAKCIHRISVHRAAIYSSADGEIQNRRCGRPFYSSYMRYKNKLYLPTLAKTLTRSYNELPTSTYVLRDFMLSFFGPTNISVRPNEQPLEHSISISDEDALSESITTSSRVSSDDDNVEESAGLDTSIDDDDLLPYFNNQEGLEDEATSNNEIETSRQRSPLQSSGEVTHKSLPEQLLAAEILKHPPPSQRWFQTWIKTQHETFHTIKTRPIEAAHVASHDVSAIKEWFHGFKDVCNQLDVTAANIYNFGEVGFRVGMSTV